MIETLGKMFDQFGLLPGYSSERPSLFKYYAFKIENITRSNQMFFVLVNACPREH